MTNRTTEHLGDRARSPWRDRAPMVACVLYLILIPPGVVRAQSIQVFAHRDYFGPSQTLQVGQSLVTTLGSNGEDCLSFRVFGAAAIRVDVLDIIQGREGPYPGMFLYSEVDQPVVGGTDQYGGRNVRISCVAPDLPQPEAFVPVDRTDVHPNATPHPLWPWSAGHSLLLARRAYFWENSEDLGGAHGPYGDIKINACTPLIANWTYDQFRANWQGIKDDPNYRFNHATLAGPAWSGYAPIWHPDPWSEWIDGPLGCRYSNYAFYDFGPSPMPGQAITVVVTEADGGSNNDEDVLGWALVDGSQPGPILIKARMFGWVEVERVVAPAAGGEASVSGADVYWHGGWSGVHPEELYGPTSPLFPTQLSAGSQFRPLTDQGFASLLANPSPVPIEVGLIGTHFPAVTIVTPMTLRAVDGIAVFGSQ